MNRNLIAPLAACVIIVVGIYAYLQHDRYALFLVKRESGLVKAYKIDKTTGKLWWLFEDESEELDVPRSPSKAPLSPEQSAINLVRSSETGITDEKIKAWLQAKKGILKVYGWNAKKIDNQTYLVAYTYAEGPTATTGAWIFEVNLEAEIVRPVIGDADLEKKYSDWAENLKKKK